MNSRRTRVITGNVLKFLPFPCARIIGFCLDSRGLGVILGIPSALIAVREAANDDAPIAVIATASAIGSIFLEKFWWEREARIQEALQDDYDNAVAIKVALMQLQAPA